MEAGHRMPSADWLKIPIHTVHGLTPAGVRRTGHTETHTTHKSWESSPLSHSANCTLLTKSPVRFAAVAGTVELWNLSQPARPEKTALENIVTRKLTRSHLSRPTFGCKSTPAKQRIQTHRIRYLRPQCLPRRSSELPPAAPRRRSSARTPFGNRLPPGPTSPPRPLSTPPSRASVPPRGGAPTTRRRSRSSLPGERFPGQLLEGVH